MPPAITPAVLSASSKQIVQEPTPPSNPPTFRDVTNGLHLSADLLTAHKATYGVEVNDQDVIQAHIYKTKLINALELEGTCPTWMAEMTATISAKMDDILGPIKADINNIKTDIGGIKHDVEAMKHDIAEIKVQVQNIEKKQGQTQRLNGILYNKSCGTAAGVSLEVVLFKNGENPVEAPHNLPHIKSRFDLENMDNRVLSKYFKGYYPQSEGRTSVEERKKQILKAIGAVVMAS